MALMNGYSEIKTISELGLLIRVVHRNLSGRVLRVSNYLERAGIQKPASEMIHYPDGGSCLHLYSETGEVWKVFTYDRNGLELSNQTILPHRRRAGFAVIPLRMR